MLFPDGFSRQEAEVRTNYLDGPGTFTSSVGVIAGPREDAPLLRFLTVYLRSSLAKYFLLINAWKMLCDRNGMHLTDLEDLPFHRPEQAADPIRAQASLIAVSSALQQLRTQGREARAAAYAELRPHLDDLVFDYFGVTVPERRRVREAVEVLLPSVRPRSFKSLDTPAQQRARRKDLDRYAAALGTALDQWRDAHGGRGHFTVTVQAMNPSQTGAVGAVRVALNPDRQGAATAAVQIEDGAVAATLQALREQAMSPLPAGELLQLAPDTLVWTPTALYLIRPLARRVWLERTAYQDAERIVADVQARRPRATEHAA